MPATEANGPCTGNLKVKTRGKVPVDGKKKVVVLGSATYSVKAGTTKKVVVKLSANEPEAGQASRRRPQAAVGRQGQGRRRQQGDDQAEGDSSSCPDPRWVGEPDFTPPHADLTFMTPLSEERARPARRLPGRRQPGHRARHRLRLGRAAAARARAGAGRHRRGRRPRRRRDRARSDPGRPPWPDRPGGPAGQRRPRPAGRMGPGRLHRRLAGVGRAGRGAAAVAVRRRAGRPARPGPSRWSRRLRRRHLVAATDAGSGRSAGRTRRRVPHPRRGGRAGRRGRLRAAGRARGVARRVGRLRVRVRRGRTPAGWPSTTPTTPRPTRSASSPSASGRRTSPATAASSASATSSCWLSRDRTRASVTNRAASWPV